MILYGWGFIDKLGSMIIFEAKDRFDAEKTSNGDLLISRNLFIYNLVEWKMTILAKEVCDK